MNAHIFFVILSFLFIACSEENPSDVFVNSANGESSSSVIELSSSDIGNSSSSENFAISSSPKAVLSSSSDISYGELIDERDGHVYKTVKIGHQTWMAENLNYAYTQPITNYYVIAKDSASWCYNNEPDSCAKYGRLYVWDAAMGDDANLKKQSGLQFHEYYDYSPKGICPDHWHLPSVNEWNSLTSIALEFELKSTSGWINNGNGSDTYGFAMLPAGIYRDEKPWFIIGTATCFWTPTQWTTGLHEFSRESITSYEGAYAFCFSIYEESLSFFSDELLKGDGLSVRCIKDSTEAE